MDLIFRTVLISQKYWAENTVPVNAHISFCYIIFQRKENNINKQLYIANIHLVYIIYIKYICKTKFRKA
jgi:hypothetical protein